MDDDRSELRASSNDNANGGRQVEASPARQYDMLVKDIARLIGRQIAKEDFERRRMAADNDNA